MDILEFGNMAAARRYLSEMSEDALIQIAEWTLWQTEDGSIIVAEDLDELDLDLDATDKGEVRFHW